MDTQESSQLQRGDRHIVHTWANRGLYTMKERDGHEYLCPYLGQIQKREANHLPTGEYTFYDPTKNQYVHGNPATSYGPYANDPPQRAKRQRQNHISQR